ncbi:MAG: class I adenylate-forming enzyme family protein [Pseudomonadota bacterium]
MNIAHELTDAAARWPDATALLFEDQRIGFAALAQRAGHWQAALVQLGVRAGERIAMLLPNGPDFAYGYYATVALGAVFVPLDPVLKADELAEILADLEPRLLVVADESLNAAREALAIKGSQLLLHTVTEVEQAGRATPFAPVALDALTTTAVVLYTSGTVGGPKGVALSHDALTHSMHAMIDVFGIGPGDVYGLAVPMSHISGPMLLGTGMRSGMALLLFDRFVPARFLDAAEQHRMTLAHMVPPMANALLHSRSQHSLESMKYLCTFGMTASPEMLHQFHARWPHIGLASGYGLTETGPLVVLGPATFPPEKYGAVGHRLTYAGVRVVDDEGADLPAGESGEVWLSGPSLMQGYWRRPELTAEMMPDGWFRTGDIGMFDADGYLWIQGRKKDVINVAGLKVYAPEVEDAIYKHPDVAEVAVIGVTGGLKGEAVKAVVVPKPGATLAASDIIEHCRGLLADYKVPRQVELRADSLPRSRTGKINKEALRKP